MALVLGALMLGTVATTAVPGLPAPRELARSVLETHGQELKLLKLLGVSRTTFDWGTHFSINFTARHPPCPKNLRGTGCRARPGRVQRCVAQVSVFSFLPEVPLSMVECGREMPPAAPRGAGGQASSSSSSSSSSPSSRPPPRPRPPAEGTPRGPLSPAGLQ